MEIVLSYVNKLKKQLETFLLRWYNNIVILWENQREVQCGQAVCVGVPVGCVAKNRWSGHSHPRYDRQRLLGRYAEEQGRLFATSPFL